MDNYTRTITALMGALKLSCVELEQRVLDLIPALVEQRARHWTKGAHGYFTGSYSDGNGSGGAGLDKSGGSGIINVDETGTAVSDVHYIGKINIDIYKCVTEDIQTDEVIITEVQAAHIQERHPGVYEKYGKYIGEIVGSPDYILEANKPNTALVLKQISTENGYTKTALRLHTSSDDPTFKNSIITMVEIDEKTWVRLIKNKKVLYKHE